MSKRVIVLLAGGLAIALVAAGCGGGGSSNSTSTASISKAEFEKKASAICSKAGKALQQEAVAYAKEHHINGAPTESQLAAIAEAIAIPNIQNQVNEIRALGAPAGEEKRVEETLAAVEEGLEEIKKDPAKVLKPESQTPALAKAHKLSQGIGLEGCGEG